MGRFVVDEQPGAAALSDLMLGAPLGFTDKAALSFFAKAANEGTTEEKIEQFAHSGIVPSNDVQIPAGPGIGPILSDIAAFLLFGLHARSLLLLFLLLLGLSVGCYVLRFWNERLWIAAIYLAALTFMLLDVGLETPFWATQAPIGGYRSYILLAILPVLHWCFELVSGKSHSRREALSRGFLLAVQVAIFGVTVLVRYSPICFLPAVAGAALFSLRSGALRRTATIFIVPLFCLLAVLYGVLPLAFPQQAKNGTLRAVIWHRAFISFNLNPDWPFGNLHDRYS
jgi:hypothetical protein